jgi:hypothetical protein
MRQDYNQTPQTFVMQQGAVITLHDRLFIVFFSADISTSCSLHRARRPLELQQQDCEHSLGIRRIHASNIVSVNLREDRIIADVNLAFK